jgi:hypothetical protein
MPPGDQLAAMLQEWLVSSRDPGVSSLAAFALAHLPARESAAPISWQATLQVLLGLNRAGSTTGQPVHATQQRASGVPPSRHAVELAVLLSRAVGSAGSGMLRQESAAEQRSTPSSVVSAVSNPVTAFVAGSWQQVVAAVGSETAWALLRAVAAREVLTVPQWRSAAAWFSHQPHQQQQQQRDAAVLGAAWSSVVWVAGNKQAVCGN